VKPALLGAAAVGAAAAAAGVVLSDRAPYPYAQHRLLDILQIVMFGSFAQFGMRDGDGRAINMLADNILIANIRGADAGRTMVDAGLVDAYTLVFAGVMLPAGMAGDRLGRKRLMLAGLAVFLAASLWCALSVSAGELIAARAVMGLGAGIVFPLSLAVVTAAFSDAERPKAIGILTAGIALGLPLGPVLGGLLLQHFSWQSVFWINVPAAFVTLAAGAALMPESRNLAAPRLDVLGALLCPAAVTFLVWGFINGPEHGWTAPSTWGLLAGSAVLLAAGFHCAGSGPEHPWAPRSTRSWPPRAAARPGSVPR
jgi:MFS family permease